MTRASLNRRATAAPPPLPRCPCGSTIVWLILPGTPAGPHPQHGLPMLPVASRVFCSTGCAPDSWPWGLATETRGERSAR
jgi:hypothetical protein